MSNRTIFNELGENRVINPRSGFSQFVDLSNNQTNIAGIKTFLNNLITNSNVNFNTTANIGRIVFHPNEPAGSGDIIMAVYTENENATTGWKFSADGNLYYFGLGLMPNKITFLPDGTINILNNFYTLGSIYSNTYGSYSNGDITFINNLALGDKTITTTGTISCLDISSNGIIYAKDINLQPSGYLNVNNITSSGTTGLYQTAIFLSNEFIDINNSSLDIIAQYIGFGNPQQTFTTASKYMYIKPLSTGDFEMLISNITNKILSSDWATTKMSSQFIWNFNNASNITNISLDATTTSGDRLVIYGVASGTKYLYYNTSDELGVIETSTTIWKINGLGAATFTSLNAGSGTISTTGTISCLDISSNGIIYAKDINLQPSGYLNVNNITSSSTTGSYQTKIALSNEFIDINDSSLDIVATYIGFASPIQTLSTASKYMYIKPLSTGDFEMIINNISNKILSSDWATTKMSSQYIWNFNNLSNQYGIILDPSPSASYRLQVFGTAGGIKKLYYNTSNELGVIETVTTIWKINGAGDATFTSLSAGSGLISTTGNINGAIITGSSLSAGSGLISTTGNINGAIITGSSLSAGSGTISTTGTISGVGITGRTLDLKNASAITNITLDATTTSGNRLVIYGVASGTKYLYYNTSNNIGLFNTSTGTSVWSIDGTTGNIVTIGSYSVGSLSATSFLCNSMSPLSGTVINIGATSEFNFLKSVGVSRVRLYPTSTSGDIMQITKVSDATFTSGYWYFNNTGNFGYNTGGISVWELLNTGGLTLRGNLQMLFDAIISSNTYSSNTLTDGGTYRNTIKMNTLLTASTIGSIELSSRYINFVNPYQTLDINSKYMFILPDSGGNFSQYINNVNARVLQTDWSNLVLKTDYNFQCFGKYNYIEGAQQGNLCGHWSNRTGTLGWAITNNSNNWVFMGGMENNNTLNIGSGFPNAGSSNRVFTWLIENSSGSGKALGLACNRINAPNSNINQATSATGFILLGHFATNRGAGAAYSFTGEHSSMVCDEEYNDIMNYNTDDFIGMVVCSSGKIYNLPYDVDGNTNEKQVDNIKPIDAQPMTKLSKKYKDKSVLGVISHIEKVGKDRNNITGGSWTAALSLDKDERRRIRVASIGEGGIWITNENGNIENGDYITTSKIAGYSTKQDDDLMHNYTIAKATMDCVFDIEKPDEYKTKYLGDGIYASYIGCTYHSG